MGIKTTTYIDSKVDDQEWTYISGIIPALPENWALTVFQVGNYAFDDFYIYDAQGYTLEQWDDYVARGAN